MKISQRFLKNVTDQEILSRLEDFKDFLPITQIMYNYMYKELDEERRRRRIMRN